MLNGKWRAVVPKQWSWTFRLTNFISWDIITTKSFQEHQINKFSLICHRQLIQFVPRAEQGGSNILDVAIPRRIIRLRWIWEGLEVEGRVENHDPQTTAASRQQVAKGWWSGQLVGKEIRDGFWGFTGEWKMGSLNPARPLTNTRIKSMNKNAW